MNFKSRTITLLAILTSLSSHLVFGQDVKRWDGYAQPGDTRQVRGPSSPKWLEAVGFLSPTDKPKTSYCTINLVTNELYEHSRVALTNSHCLINNNAVNFKTFNYKTFNDYENHFIKNNLITFTSNTGKKVIVKPYKVFWLDEVSKSNRFRDYAIIILDRVIKKNEIAPLLYDLHSEHTMREYLFSDDFEIVDEEDLRMRESYRETLAGYSCDKNASLGNNCKNLTYDSNCTPILSNENMDENGEQSLYRYEVENCFSYPGSSGGALVQSFYEWDGEENESVFIIGVNRGATSKILKNGQYDSSKNTIVPVHNFLVHLDSAVNEYNKKQR